MGVNIIRIEKLADLDLSVVGQHIYISAKKH